MNSNYDPYWDIIGTTPEIEFEEDFKDGKIERHEDFDDSNYDYDSQDRMAYQSKLIENRRKNK